MPPGRAALLVSPRWAKRSVRLRRTGDSPDRAKWDARFQRAAGCVSLRATGARFGFSPDKAKRDARASRAGIRLRGGRTRRKKPAVSSFLPIIYFPSGAPRARFIVVPQNSCHPPAKAIGMVWLPPQKGRNFPSCCYSKMGGKTSAQRTFARVSAPLFAAANAANLRADA